MGYERCGELPLIASRLEPMFKRPLKYLDVGSGDAVFPTFVLKNSCWDITCVDKFSSVRQQHSLAQRVMGSADYSGRFHVVEQDILSANLPPESFDVVTNISVIEHFEGNSDSEAMRRSAQLLKPGGMYILTTPLNDGHFKEFYLDDAVYGKPYETEPVFFQRHYDVDSFNERVVKPSGLQEIERLYFGDYGFPFAERFMVMPWPWKPLKLFYQWATPALARMFLSYRDYPIGRPGMHMFTSSGVFVLMKKHE